MINPEIKVGFDVTWMNAKNTGGGIFQYAERLITALAKHTNIGITAIISENSGDWFKSIQEYPNFKAVLLKDSISFLEVLERDKINVVHTPAQLHRHFTVRVPMITTLHDLQHFHFPDFFTDKEIQFRNLYYKKSAEFSERIIVSFKHVKEDVQKFYDISPDKIDVCSLGTSPPITLNKSELPAIKKKYNLPENYLFYGANTWKHKNHINLIQALKIVHEYGKKISLVCTGQKREDFFPEIVKEIKKHDLQEYVIFLGYIPENEMMLIMSNAALVVIPTLYEAGSFPLLEAMKYGVPVICSNVTALPDQIGDKRFIFDPNNIEQISSMINLMLKDEQLCKENIVNSKKQTNNLKWETKVSGYVESYERAIEGFESKRADKFFIDYVSNYDFFINKYYQHKNNLLQEQLNSLHNSLIWRLSLPLRKLLRLLK
jgi:glycosyltransferase involved in cell wall biosynthesis